MFAGTGGDRRWPAGTPGARAREGYRIVYACWSRLRPMLSKAPANIGRGVSGVEASFGTGLRSELKRQPSSAECWVTMPPPSILTFNALAHNELVRHRQKRPPLRQQFLKRRVDPHGQRSLLPRRSTNSTSPSLIARGPRFTRASDGKPLRRLLIGSKGERALWICLFSWHGCLLALVG
jgi:hypothetical protein